MKPILMSLALVLAAGCASYTWRSTVPEKMRTVQVPTFRNSSKIVESGSVATRQLLREIQREGTFAIVSDGAALEIQGEVKSVGAASVFSSYRQGSRFSGGTMEMTAEISIIDKVHGRVLVDNRLYTGEAGYSSGQDSTTAIRDASGRAADMLAQRVVDDLLKLNFKGKTEK